MIISAALLLDRDTRPRPAAYAAVAAAFFTNAAVFAAWVPRIPAVQARLGLDDGQLGLALLGLPAGLIASMPIAGWVVGRVGSRRSTVASAVLASLAISLPALADSLLGLLLALCAVGIVNAVLDVAMNVQGIAIERASGRPRLSYFHSAFSFGSLCGAAIGAAAASAGVRPLPQLLGVGAVFALASLALAPGLLPDRGPSEPAHQRLARPDRALLMLGLLAACTLIGEGAVADWSAVLLRRTLGASAGAAGLGYVAFSITMGLGALAGSRLTERLGAVRVVRAAGAATSACTLVVVLSHSLPVAIAGFAGLGAALSCVFPLALSAAGRHPASSPNVAVATVSVLGYTGLLAGPPLVGLIAQLASLPLALGLVGQLGIAICLLAQLVEAPQPPRDS